MATPKRARSTSSSTRSKKAAAPQAQETSVQQQSQFNAEDAIRFRAYQLFEQRGRTHGFDIEDWLRAESEVVSHSA